MWPLAQCLSLNSHLLLRKAKVDMIPGYSRKRKTLCCTDFLTQIQAFGRSCCPQLKAGLTSHLPWLTNIPSHP